MIASRKLYTLLTSVFLSPTSHSFLTRQKPTLKPSVHRSIDILLIFIFHCLLPFYPYSLYFKNKNYFPPLVVLLFLRAFFFRRWSPRSLTTLTFSKSVSRTSSFFSALAASASAERGVATLVKAGAAGANAEVEATAARRVSAVMDAFIFLVFYLVVIVMG